MKLSKFIPALLITVIALTGCDSVRSFLGKPTSEDIRKAREEQIKAERALADSARTEVAAAVPEQQTQETAGTIHRYNVVVGSFINPAYAKRLAGPMTSTKPAANSTLLNRTINSRMTAGFTILPPDNTNNTI